MTKDMTAGSPMKLVLGFAVPLMFGNLFQQFYSMVDTIIVGRFLGTGPLAAVGSTGSINFLILGFCLGICSGFSIPVSQSYGAKDYKDLRRFVGNILWLAVGFTLLVTLLTVALCRPILEWMDTPADIIDDAYHYIVVIFLGIPTVVLYNILASLLRALGDSRTPVVFLVLSSLLNIGLDLFLILVIPMGVAGAAWATVISQGISGLACLAFICKKFPLLHVTRDDLHFRPEYARRLLSMGLPMGLQFSITAIGSVYSLLALTVLALFGRPLTLLFVDSSETLIIDQAYQFIVIQAAFFIPLAGVNVFRLLIQGMGYSKVAVFAGVFEMVARGTFGLFLVPRFGFLTACFASPAAWILADCFLIPAYRKVVRDARQNGR